MFFQIMKIQERLARKNPSQHRYRLTSQGRLVLVPLIAECYIVYAINDDSRVSHTLRTGRSTAGDRRESLPRGRAVASRTQVTRYLRHVTLNFFRGYTSRLRFYAFLGDTCETGEIGEEEKEEQVGEEGKGGNRA